MIPVSDVIRSVQDLIATCTSPQGGFTCTFVLIPLVILGAFVLTFASVVVGLIGQLASPFLGRIGSKTCPQCGETVRKKAAICRFCRYVFPDVPPPP